MTASKATFASMPLETRNLRRNWDFNVHKSLDLRQLATFLSYFFVTPYLVTSFGCLAACLLFTRRSHRSQIR